MIAFMYYEFDTLEAVSEMGKFCDILTAWRSKQKIFLALPFRKNFKNLHKIEHELHIMKETGQINRIKHKYSTDTLQCKTNDKISIGYEKVAPLFMLVILGTVLSLVYFILFEIKY